jgi:putative SOS response-associated peptidase YedK
MPVILQEADFGNWLDVNVTEPSKVAAMVEKAQSDFVHHPVTTRLNSAKTDEEDFVKVIVPVKESW